MAAISSATLWGILAYNAGKFIGESFENRNKTGVLGTIAAWASTAVVASIAASKSVKTNESARIQYNLQQDRYEKLVNKYNECVLRASLQNKDESHIASETTPPNKKKPNNLIESASMLDKQLDTKSSAHNI